MYNWNVELGLRGLSMRLEGSNSKEENFESGFPSRNCNAKTRGQGRDPDTSMSRIYYFFLFVDL